MHSGLAVLVSSLLAPLAIVSPWALVGRRAPPAAAAATETPAAKAKTKKATLAVVSLKENYPEGPAPAGIFGELKPHLREVIERLDKAAKDDKIAGVMLKLRGPELGMGKVDELRGPSPGCARRARKSMPTSKKLRPRTI